MGFINDAIRYQEESCTIQQANRNFNRSCRICSEKGLIRSDCEACPVNSYHNSKIETLKIMEEFHCVSRETID